MPERSRFFEQLVNDRRDGIAPPQVEQRAEAEPPPPLEVTFSLFSGTGLVVCDRCGACIDTLRAPDHTDWHRRVGG